MMNAELGQTCPPARYPHIHCLMTLPNDNWYGTGNPHKFNRMIILLLQHPAKTSCSRLFVKSSACEPITIACSLNTGWSTARVFLTSIQIFTNLFELINTIQDSSDTVDFVYVALTSNVLVSQISIVWGSANVQICAMITDKDLPASPHSCDTTPENNSQNLNGK